MDLSEPLLDIESFLKQLHNASKAQYIQLLRRLEFTDQELDQYTHFSSEGYTRHCFRNTGDWEVLLLCWDVNQKTPVHAHGGQECWVMVVRGQIEENIFEQQDEDLSLKSNKICEQGNISYMNDEIGLHTLGAHNGRAVTLHLYAKPIGECKIFDQEGSLIGIREMEPDTVGV